MMEDHCYRFHQMNTGSKLFEWSEMWNQLLLGNTLDSSVLMIRTQLFIVG